jgi:hypothetical protein
MSQLHGLAALTLRKKSWDPLDRRLGGPILGLGCCGEDKNQTPVIKPTA